MNNQVLIVGGGVAGLIAAIAFLKGSKASQQITLIESSDSLGGGYSSCEVVPNVYFDRGVHLVPEVDFEPFKSFFDDKEVFEHGYWKKLSYPLRDRHGMFYSGKRNDQTSLFNTRRFLSRPLSDKIEEEFFRAPGVSVLSASSLQEYLLLNFGESLGVLLGEIFGSKFNADPEALSAQIVTLFPISRIVLDGVDLATSMKLESQKMRIGFPDQEHLPSQFVPTSSNFYPKVAGISTFIERIERYLVRNGVRIEKGARVQTVSLSNSGPTHVHYMKKGGEEVHLKADKLIWSAPGVFLEKLVNSDCESKQDLWAFPSYSRPRNALKFIHFVCNRDVLCSKPFYYYCYNKTQNFRLTNYSSFTNHPIKYSYTLELIVSLGEPHFEAESALEIIERVFIDIGVGLSAKECVEKVWVDDHQTILPSFDIVSNRSSEGREIPSSVKLFGSAATGKFQLTREMYKEALELLV